MWFRNAGYINVSGLTIYGDPSAPYSVSHGGAVFQYTGDTYGIDITNNDIYGSSAWAATMHIFYVGAGSVRDLTISGNLMDGRGSDGAGYHSYHDPNGTHILVANNTIRNFDQCVMIWSDTSSLVLRDNKLDHCRIGIRYHNSNGTLLDGNTATSMSETRDRARLDRPPLRDGQLLELTATRRTGHRGPSDGSTDGDGRRR